MSAKVEVKAESQGFSFEGWNLIQFLRGRKKLIITLVSAGLAYLISDSSTVAVVSGAVVEMGFSLAEYYVKER